MSNFDEDWLQAVAADIKLPTLSPGVTRTLLPVIEAHIRQLLQQSYKYTRKSHNKAMTVEDFNLALMANKIEPVYGFSDSDRPSVRSSDDNKTPGLIYLTEYAITPLPPIPLKPQLHLHWLAVHGEQPMISENPSISCKSSKDDDVKSMALPKEMQVALKIKYFRTPFLSFFSFLIFLLSPYHFPVPYSLADCSNSTFV